MQHERVTQGPMVLMFHDVYRVDPDESGFAGAAAGRYKLQVRDFERQLDGVAAADARAPVLMSLDPADTVITVDDGGVSFHTLIADRLEARGWRAHCFVSTGYIGKPGFLDAARIRDLHARGHRIGSHTVTHPDRLDAYPWHRIISEWEDSQKRLQDIIGAQVSTASVPGGRYSPLVARIAQAVGLTTLFTSEPQLTVEHVDDGAVFGRFAVRHGAHPDFCRRLVERRPATRITEWAAWNAKKQFKQLAMR